MTGDALTAVGIAVSVLLALGATVYSKLDRHGRKIVALEVKIDMVLQRLKIPAHHKENGD